MRIRPAAAIAAVAITAAALGAMRVVSAASQNHSGTQHSTAAHDSTAHHAAMQHGGMQHGSHDTGPTQTGESAFAAISEIVRILESDSATDWGKVNLEALRQHLIDMDLVTVRAAVRQGDIAGGVTLEISGDAAVAAAARRMVISHAQMLNRMPAFRAEASATPNGVRLVVTAKENGDAATVARIRGLGFAGLMVQGDHHTVHHLMIARGEHVH